jgi:hypothetical protein
MEPTTVEVIFRASTIKEELSNLKYVLSRKDFYEKNKYRVAYPDNPILQSTEILKNPDLMFETFKNSEYDKKFYEEGIESLTPLKSRVEQLIGKLLVLKNYWDFKTFPSYQIVLTRYGPGGNYHYNIGKIVMLTAKDGQFRREDPVQTIVHEITHIGIEESIVQKFKLSHWEKERLVDLTVSSLFEKEMPSYKMQDTGFTNLDNYVSIKTLDNLPSVIEHYICNNKFSNTN